MGLRIALVSPEMSGREFSAFVDDIKVNGQLVPILVRGEEIVDGRKRLAACQKIGIEVQKIDLLRLSEQTPEEVARSLNILWTHYNASQRAMYAARRATMTRTEAAKMRVGRQKATPPDLELYERTVAGAAAWAGVSITAVAVAKRVLRTATAEVVAAVESGKLTLHSAKQILKTTRGSDQPQAVKSVVETSRGKRLQDSARALGLWDGSKRLPKRDVPACIERGLDQIGNVLDTLEELVSERNGAGAGMVLAPGFRITADSLEDGIVEAIEDPQHPFLLAVQWHPERMVKDHPEHLALFHGLVVAATRTGKP